MAKRLQRRIVENKRTLPTLLVASGCVWLLAGVVVGHWWGALACFVATVMLLIQLNKSYALMRVYTPMISSSFLVLSAAACPLFADFQGELVQACWAAYFMLLFHSYQNPVAAGSTYYAYLSISVASLVFVQILCLLPFLWLLQYALLQSLSRRTWYASFFGLLTPYWCWFGGLMIQQDFTPIADHFRSLADWGWPLDVTVWSVGQVGALFLLLLVGTVGVVHYLRQGHLDSIRVSRLYKFFIWATGLVVFALLLQPTFYDRLMPMLLVSISPLAAHYLVFTDTRLTNIAVQAFLLLALLITVYNLCTSSLLF